jgi:two-component sensor histidine kinase
MPYGADVRKPLNVLFIDDDPALSVLVRKALNRRGHEVFFATDGEAGMKRLAADDIDVIALDHELVGESGLDFLERLGPRGPRPPVVYVTGSADARTAIAAIRAGADEYVIKESAAEFFELLIAAIEQVYERWRLKRQERENEIATRQARDRFETLLHEVNHRVANSLGLVAAMVRMQANALDEPAAVRALQETQTRINAIAGVHRRLYVSEQIGLVEIDDYLAHLVNELQDSLADSEHKHRIEFSSEKLTIHVDKAISLGVIVGELVTNAFKYAYPPRAEGEIRVSLAAAAYPLCRLTVEDDGKGFATETLATGTGLGSRIMTAMASNLQGSLTKEPTAKGARFVLDFPLKTPQVEV